MSLEISSGFGIFCYEQNIVGRLLEPVDADPATGNCDCDPYEIDGLKCRRVEYYGDNFYCDAFQGVDLPSPRSWAGRKLPAMYMFISTSC